MPRILTLLSLVFAFFACGKKPPSKFNRLAFSYQDSSVPPPYHRSYSIQIKEDGQGQFTIRSYSDTLHQGNFQVAEAEIKAFWKSAKQLESAGHKGAEAMSGSSQSYLSLHQDDQPVYELSWTNKGGIQASTIALVEQLKSFVPDFKEKIRPASPTEALLQEAQALKKQILNNTDSDKEASLLKAFWRISRELPEAQLYVALRDSAGAPIPINEGSQGDSLYVRLDAPAQEQSIELQYVPLDIQNKSQLLYE